MHKILLAAIAIVTGTVAVTSLYADDSGTTGGGAGMMMSPGMMGEGGTMPMTERMSDMMEHCSQMMQGAGDAGSGIPNEQWKKKAPATPEKDN